jgi:hypothetical protein
MSIVATVELLERALDEPQLLNDLSEAPIKTAVECGVELDFADLARLLGIASAQPSQAIQVLTTRVCHGSESARIAGQWQTATQDPAFLQQFVESPLCALVTHRLELPFDEIKSLCGVEPATDRQFARMVRQRFLALVDTCSGPCDHQPIGDPV